MPSTLPPDGRRAARMFVLVLQSQSPASISSFLSLSLVLFLSFFPIITQHTESFHVFLHVILSSPFLQSLLLLFIIIYNNYMDLPYNLYVCFFFHSFLFRFIYLSSKKRIKKDFVVAASKCNEMLSLPSIHKFVFRFKLTFFAFILDSTDFIPNRIIFRESSDNTIPVRRNRAFQSDRTVSSDLCPLSTCIRK